MCTAKQLKTLIELKAMKKEIETSIKVLETEIYNDYGKEKGSYQLEDMIININLINRVSLDSTRLKKEHPAIFEMYKRESCYNTIAVKQMM